MSRIYVAHALTNSAGSAQALAGLIRWLSRRRITITEPRPALFPGELAVMTLRAIEKADLVIADVSFYSHGVGFELGYAYALRKPIVVVVQTACTDKVSPFIMALFPDIFCYSDSAELIEHVASRLRVVGEKARSATMVGTDSSRGRATVSDDQTAKAVTKRHSTRKRQPGLA